MKNTKSTRVYTDFNEFIKNEPEAVKSLIETFNTEGDVLMTYDYNWKTFKKTPRPMDSLDDLIEHLREIGDGEEEIDSCYITVVYESQTHDGRFGFEVVGSSYRKDQSVCDEQMADEVTIIDLELLKIEKTEEKKLKSKKKLKSAQKQWDTFFKNKSLGELQTELKKYSFPKLIK